MALQTIDTVITSDPSNPVELQAWFQAHPLAVITAIFVSGNLFYIVHT